jgi:hypothetical protein
VTTRPNVLVAPFDPALMRMRPASAVVDSVRNDGPELLDPELDRSVQAAAAAA